MTEKALAKMGFYLNGSLNKEGGTRIFHPESDTDFCVQNLDKMKDADFIVEFKNVIFEAGVSWGKSVKAEEIKKALNI